MKIQLMNCTANYSTGMRTVLKSMFVSVPIQDKKRLKEVFKQYRPQIVLHAAAHKHVPLMEDAPGEAIKNNVAGTMNVLEAASESAV